MESFKREEETMAIPKPQENVMPLKTEAVIEEMPALQEGVGLLKQEGERTKELMKNIDPSKAPKQAEAMKGMSTKTHKLLNILATAGIIGGAAGLAFTGGSLDSAKQVADSVTIAMSPENIMAMGSMVVGLVSAVGKWGVLPVLKPKTPKQI